MVRKEVVRRKLKLYKDTWPIDRHAGTHPEGWNGWPEHRKFALILTHDVDTQRGQDKCYELVQLEKDLGFRSSFNFVPQRYHVSNALRHYLQNSGFEIGVHDLNHDGRLYESKKIFDKKAEHINRYLKKWNATGFRSGSMHSNLDWIHNLNIEYDASTFDTDPFEPFPQGTGTIFPLRISRSPSLSGYIELPYTLPQDFTLFILMEEKKIDIWKNKLDWIADCGGMALMNTHPDYMNFQGGKLKQEEYPADYYREFLEYIKYKYEGKFWHVLPMDIARYWQRKVNKMNHN